MKRNVIVLMLVMAALSSCSQKENSSSSELSAKVVATESQTSETSTETSTSTEASTSSSVSTTSSTTTALTTSTALTTTTAKITTVTATTQPVTTIITTTTEPETTAAPETTEPETETPLDPSLTVTDYGVVWDCGGVCTVTFPLSWKDRIYVEGMSVYSKKCWEDEEGSGRLFSVELYSAEQIIQGIGSCKYLLGVSNGKYVFPVTATDVNYNLQNPELHNEYTNLANDLQNIIPNIICSSSPDFTPINIENYTQSDYIQSPHMDGTWMAHDDIGVQFSPLVVFDSANRTFGFKKDLNGDYEIGAFWENENIDSYSNSTYWGDCGLIFMNGGIYRVTYYPSAPVTMNFETLYGDNAISAYTFEYWNDSKSFEQ